MQIILVDLDRSARRRLFPLTLTRPLFDLRVGILTIKEKWKKAFGGEIACITEPYLAPHFGRSVHPATTSFVLIREGLCPNDALIERIKNLKAGQGLKGAAGPMILKVDKAGFDSWFLRDDAAEFDFDWDSAASGFPLDPLDEFTQIVFPEDIFLENGKQIAYDFDVLTKGRISAPLHPSNTVIGDRVFAEDGATAMHSTLNSETGPIYLGAGSEIWEGCMIRGPFALGENSQVKMGAKIYPNVTVGPYSRVAGEINTSVIWGFSAKGHEGYMGNSVVGAWCNWGAGTNNSNMKNNYGAIRLYDYETQGYRNTALQFCGTIMGDHVKTAIQTPLNSGTVVGTGAQIACTGFPPKWVPQFTWNVDETYELEKFLKAAQMAYTQKGQTFQEMEKQILIYLYKNKLL